jgi:hypothetical protein
MGTSSARRGPSTAVWRLAKGAATRYLAPEGASPVGAREVVRRYVAALKETSVAQSQDLLAEFRLTRKAAQCLGEFGDLVAGSGLIAALEPWGLPTAPQDAPEIAIFRLISAWVEEDGGLESAVARTALATCLEKVLASAPARKSRVDSSTMVKSFLAIALCQRLTLDLGESLEAAATGWPEFKNGLAKLADELSAATAAIPEDPPRAGQWQGLAGWLWVTQVLGNILKPFQDAKPL